MATQRPFIGTIPAPADCRVPDGARLVEIKQCEGCPRTFLRTTGTGQKFCVACGYRMLLPDRSVLLFDGMQPKFGHINRNITHYDQSMIVDENEEDA